MIFRNLDKKEIEDKLLSKENSFLLMETHYDNLLNLFYLDHNKNIISKICVFDNQGDWYLVPESDDDIVITTLTPGVFSYYYNKLVSTIKNDLKLINFINPTDVNEISQKEIYSFHFNKIEPFVYNDSWIHQLALEYCFYNEDVLKKNRSTFELNGEFNAKLFLESALFDLIKDQVARKSIEIQNECSTEQIKKNGQNALHFTNLIKEREEKKNKNGVSSKSTKLENNANIRMEVSLNENHIFSIKGDCRHKPSCESEGKLCDKNQEDRAFFKENITLHESWNNYIPELLMYTIQKLVIAALKKHPNDCAEIGSTLTVAFIHEDKITTAWLGDTRALYLTNKIKTTEFVYIPHNPSEPLSKELENDRIESSGGKLYRNRVGGLSVCRTIGDCGPSFAGISHTPSITVKPINSAEKANLLIYTDGVSIPINRIVHINANDSDDNIIQNCGKESYILRYPNNDDTTLLELPLKNNSLGGVFDGHAFKKRTHDAYLIAEFAQQEFPNLFQQFAAKPRSEVLAGNKIVENTSNNTSNQPVFSGFFYNESPSLKHPFPGPLPEEPRKKSQATQWPTPKS